VRSMDLAAGAACGADSYIVGMRHGVPAAAGAETEIRVPAPSKGGG
jgi:hypothetical protein